MKLLSDCLLVFRRSLRQTMRNPTWVVFNLGQPIFYLVLFGPLLKNAATAQGFPPGGAFNVFVPGLAVQMSLFGTAFVGFTLLTELRSGVLERLQVTPISRLALLIGRTARDVLALALQVVFLLLLAVPFGLDADPAGAAAVIGLVLLLGVAFSALSYSLALALRSEEALTSLLYSTSVPLLLLSGVLLPLSLAPEWLQRVAAANPLSHAVTAARALFSGETWGADVGVGVGVVVALAAASLFLAARRFQRTIA